MKYQVVPILIILTYATLVHTQELPSTPVLTLELGQHRAKLTGVSVDDANRFLVTSCEDKTARVWDLLTGKLLSTLRPPFGDGKDGMLYTAAISPDGEKIAVGGWTGPEGISSIYIFDRESGRIEHRLSGLRQVIFNLKFSSNGKYLAALLGGKQGLRVYETETFNLIYSDTDYEARSERLDFSRDSQQLVSSSSDGLVRFYKMSDDGITQVAKTRVSEIGSPYGVAFSPHGDKVAVGDRKSNKVAIVSSVDPAVVSHLVATDLKEISVAWSHDGQTLFAAGYDGVSGQIVYWTGSQSSRIALTSKRGIYDIAALADGLVFGHARPSWGRLDSNNKQVQFVDSVIPNYGRSPNGLLVNDKLSIWEFSSNQMPRSPISFSLRNRKLNVGKQTGEKLFPPSLNSKSLEISNCCDGSESPPQLNGRELLLDKYERSNALAFLPDGKSLLLGTGWYLRRFNIDGSPLWKISVPSPAVSVNVGADGKVALAVCVDGTVRWYRISDGKELLTFYAPEDESGRWILWTPSGYYDASPDAEDLIGWTMNNGRDAAADFFPNHLFRAYFFRPDIIDRILDTLDESVAVELANKKAGRKENDLTIAKVLPPVLEVNQARSRDISNSTVTINYTIRRHTNEPVTGIKVYLDGKQTKAIPSPPIQTKGNSNAITISVPRRDTELMLAAENRFTTGVPVKIQLKWRSKPEISKASPFFRHKSAQFSFSKVHH